jgi:hypothetical protein
MDARNQREPSVASLKGVFANFNEQAHQDLSAYRHHLVCVWGVGNGGGGDRGGVRCALASKYVSARLKDEARSQ